MKAPTGLSLRVLSALFDLKADVSRHLERAQAEGNGQAIREAQALSLALGACEEVVRLTINVVGGGDA